MIKRFKIKWLINGDFILVDIGCVYYVVKFINMNDYNYVLILGLWLINDYYFII